MSIFSRIIYKRILLFAAVALAVLLVYAITSMQRTDGVLLMPLDDVYIHFQYARQFALGEPYVYNPGDMPTSGATSFLYPLVLAAGYLVGFQGVWLGLWAMIVGGLALVAAMRAVAEMVDAFGAPHWVGTVTGLLFGLTGSVVWHAMSGMETALMMALSLWVLLCFVRKSLSGLVITGVLLALMRPEGSLMAAGAALLMGIRLWNEPHKGYAGRWRLVWLLVPVAAMGVQPVVNLWVTGSSVATGNQAKSILAMVPPDGQIIISRIAANFVQMWQEFITGYARSEGWYMPLPLVLLALLGLVSLFFKRDWRLTGLLLVGWLVGVTAAVSTLDTAFWHFKRYQMPLIALFYPLAAWGGLGVLRMLRRRKWLPSHKMIFGAGGLAATVLGIFIVGIFLQFWSYYAVNVRYVYAQPYQMAAWIRENTAQDAVVAVHDVGLMRYLGGRYTLDMVGLTTPDAAAYWRNGPGSVGEFLMQRQPDYIASYGQGHGYGLYMLEDYLYGEPLATFSIRGWQRWQNVALAADTQGIYAPVWHDKLTAADAQLIDAVDVAGVQSEQAHGYEWQAAAGTMNDDGVGRGFQTLLRQEMYIPYRYNRLDKLPDEPQVMRDGYRVAVIKEQFELSHTEATQPVLLIMRVHAGERSTIDVYINDRYVATRVVPAMPGEWFDVPTLIPAALVSDENVVRIDAQTGAYDPAYHRMVRYDKRTPADLSLSAVDVTYQDNAFGLLDWEWEPEGTFTARWFTDGQAEGDYRLFVHLYDDIMQPPVAQWDGYWHGQPAGNWLPGIIDDSVQLALNGVTAGTYSLALGFYDPAAPDERLMPVSDMYDSLPDGRLWLGEVEVTQ